MTQPVLISDPARITAAWLTEALNSAGFDGRVNDFDAVSIGTGQVGENVRFSLSGSGDLPATVVGKFASPDPVSRETGISTLNYKREVHFYQQLQSRVNIQTPRCLFTDIDNETHEYIILMEDLAPGEQGDQLGGCNADQAELAMVQLAHLHGPVWGDTSILDDELITSRRANPGGIRELWDMVSPGFLARYADRLTDAEKQMVGQVGEVLDLLNTSYSIDDTLIHIDYRLDNMMFGGPHPLTVVDWQTVGLGRGSDCDTAIHRPRPKLGVTNTAKGRQCRTLHRPRKRSFFTLEIERGQRCQTPAGQTLAFYFLNQLGDSDLSKLQG